MIRIALAGYEHETNTFGTIPVTEESISEVMLSGQALIDRYKGTHSINGGTIDACRDLGIDLVPICSACIEPCGPTQKQAFEAFLSRLTEGLWQAHCQKPLDAIALNLHGAGVAEGYPDLEAALIGAVRERFGEDMLIGVALDLHANVTPEMIMLSDILTGCKKYPHTDKYDASYKVICLLHEQLTNGKKLHQALIRLPWHIAAAKGVTLSGPAYDIMLYDQDLTENTQVLKDITFFHGFPYADVSFSGASVVTIAETQEEALHYARQVAEYVWSKRKEFAAPINSAEQAMDLAEKAEGIVVINESSDNPGGGAPGDGTHLLREMLKRNLPGSVYGFIYDPEVAQKALAAGPGGRIDCLLGGKSDNRHGEPIALKGALVRTLSDGNYVRKGKVGGGTLDRIGLTALLQAGNVCIIVSEGRTQTFDDGPFRISGIDWREMRIIALKSTHHFKDWWNDRADAIIPCDSPGIHSADLSIFDYKHIDKSFYPFAEAAEFCPIAEAVH